MNIDEAIDTLDFNIKQIDNTIDILKNLLSCDIFSVNGRERVQSNLKNLCTVQHNLIKLRANLLNNGQQL